MRLLNGRRRLLHLRSLSGNGPWLLLLLLLADDRFLRSIPNDHWIVSHMKSGSGSPRPPGGRRPLHAPVRPDTQVNARIRSGSRSHGRRRYRRAQTRAAAAAAVASRIYIFRRSLSNKSHSRPSSSSPATSTDATFGRQMSRRFFRRSPESGARPHLPVWKTMTGCQRARG